VDTVHQAAAALAERLPYRVATTGVQVVAPSVD
jgi:hypothetical protein